MEDYSPRVQAYLQGQMSPEQRVAFEQEMQENPDLKKEYEFQESLFFALLSRKGRKAWEEAEKEEKDKEEKKKEVEEKDNPPSTTPPAMEKNCFAPSLL